MKMFNRGALYLIRYDTRFTYSLVALFVGLQAVILVPAMFAVDQYPDYYDTILPYVFSCDVEEFPQRDGYATRNPLTWWLRCLSFTYTENPNLLLMPFAIGILPLTYMIGSAITNDRLVGVIALGAIVFNPLWKQWAPTQTYDMLWPFLLLVSIYLIIKLHDRSSALVFVIGIMAKSITLIYLPAWIYMSIKQKAWRGIVIIGISVVVGLMFVSYTGNDVSSTLVGNEIGFYPENLTESVIRTFSMLWPIIPALVGIFIVYKLFKPRNGIQNTKDVFVWIFCSLLTTPIIHVFSMQTQYPYRFVILGVFMSILAGITIINTCRFVEETRQKKFLVK